MFSAGKKLTVTSRLRQRLLQMTTIRKWPMGNRMLTRLMTSRDHERSRSCPQYLENSCSWRCYL